MHYKKKPVVIEAIQFTGDNIPAMEIFVPVGKYHNDGTFSIVTLEGERHVSVGDYVIKDVNDEFYPCKPDIFEKTYEKVDTSKLTPDTIGLIKELSNAKSLSDIIAEEALHKNA